MRTRINDIRENNSRACETRKNSSARKYNTLWRTRRESAALEGVALRRAEAKTTVF